MDFTELVLKSIQFAYAKNGVNHSITLLVVMLLAALAFVVIASCYDGDTCTTTTGERVRLACIDTPELTGTRSEPVSARAARDHLRGLVVGRKVGIRRITRDRYGRTVAELFVDGVNVGQELVRNAYGAIYKKYARQCRWATISSGKQY